MIDPKRLERLKQAAARNGANVTVSADGSLATIMDKQGKFIFHYDGEKFTLPDGTEALDVFKRAHNLISGQLANHWIGENLDPLAERFKKWTEEQAEKQRNNGK